MKDYEKVRIKSNTFYFHFNHLQKLKRYRNINKLLNDEISKISIKVYYTFVRVFFNNLKLHYEF